MFINHLRYMYMYVYTYICCFFLTKLIVHYCFWGVIMLMNHLRYIIRIYMHLLLLLSKLIVHYCCLGGCYVNESLE